MALDFQLGQAGGGWAGWHTGSLPLIPTEPNAHPHPARLGQEGAEGQDGVGSTMSVWHSYAIVPPQPDINQEGVGGKKEGREK
eukprot:scaffold86391_cov21-Tisochrysis_lutea.AAC.2